MEYGQCSTKCVVAYGMSCLISNLVRLLPKRLFELFEQLIYWQSIMICNSLFTNYENLSTRNVQKRSRFLKKKVPKIVICNMDLFFVAFIKIQGHSLHIGISMGTNEKKKLGKKAGFPVKNPAQIFFWCQTQCDLQWKVVVKYKHSSKERY